jgi:pSer/pThr/pTyr-binding forkhead associated (FHA) protein
MKVKLLVVQGRPQGKALQFARGEFVFGRGVECHVRPNSEWVSRQHCLLRVTEEGVHLRDLNSCNGTLINGTRLRGECRLAHGDKLQVGPLVFQILLDEPAPVTAPRPSSPPRPPDAQETDIISYDTEELEAFRAEVVENAPPVQSPDPA